MKKKIKKIMKAILEINLKKICEFLFGIYYTHRPKLRNVTKLNLCCGDQRLEGYLNVDRAGSCDLKHDLRYPLPLEDGTADTIVMSQGINYFTYEEAKRVAKDMYRVLKKGGIVRVSFPDMEIFAKAYLEQDKEFLFQRLQNGEDRFVGKTIADKFISEAYFYSGVKYFYDFGSAAELFKEAGFDVVEDCEYRQSRIPDIARIDDRPELSCFLEAVK